MVFLTKMVILVKFIFFDHFWSVLGLKTPKIPLKPSKILKKPTQNYRFSYKNPCFDQNGSKNDQNGRLPYGHRVQSTPNFILYNILKFEQNRSRGTSRVRQATFWHVVRAIETIFLIHNTQSINYFCMNYLTNWVTVPGFDHSTNTVKDLIFGELNQLTNEFMVKLTVL